MFTTEHHIAKKIPKKVVTHLFKDGTSFAKSKIVSRKFTYKEFTLILGIVVALLVLITVWITYKGAPLTQDALQAAPSSLSIPTLAEVVEKSMSMILY